MYRITILLLYISNNSYIAEYVPHSLNNDNVTLLYLQYNDIVPIMKRQYNETVTSVNGVITLIIPLVWP